MARVITAENLTKRYGKTLAVDALSFSAPRGAITAFLGPNGAGKSTTMRMVMGLDRPSRGSALIDGKRVQDLPAVPRTVGAMLEMGNHQPRMSARAYLGWQAHSARLPRTRVSEVLELTGLASAARRQVGSFSLGMRQRLGIASALLGDPENLILDEPINGLDPQGVLWVRSLLTHLAAQGRTIFISSHLLAEVEAVADRIVVIGRGRLITECSMAELRERAGTRATIVSTPDAKKLVRVLREDGAQVESELSAQEVVRVFDRSASQVGEMAAEHSLRLHGLLQEKVTLEQAFMELTAGAVEFRDGGQEPSATAVPSAMSDGDPQ
ncbi:ABC transporter ATP-binding protein [Brachybacterium alimentarium]|uniref:ABC transporter ATP-binding protein n=1 Tax=Brachybacterium alimentarium TaxID=47845 RepID=UPI00336FDCC8